MKNDIRSRYTKNTIMRVFIELVKVKPVEKITVKEVCEKAQINRSTFYKYFLDCYDVLEQLENAALEKFDESLQIMEGGQKDPEVIIRSMLLFLKNNPDFEPSMFRLERMQGFITRFVKNTYDHLDRWMINEISDPARRLMIMAYIVQGSVGVIGQWVYTGMEEDPKVITKALLDFSVAVIKTP